ncbi:MAG TPA: SAM-dependent methyltransferase [Bdellovibrionales bacterium]|nr:SAM-dependent methyltransferase [Pseudobdellovibrionaceae bacterium]HAG91148.1 SAM-dependent methyltransferase [Bdellovibrionales bacterium]|tara:strand:+ start:2350 stop:3174 length:825 start_codon:yes stop_codon:yes gene_type:complete
MGAARKINPEDSTQFRKLSALVKEACGLNLTEDKDILLDTRLSRRVSQLGLDSYSEYAKLVESDQNELQACIELLTTHKTEWFREFVHFQWLKEQLPKLSAKGNRIQIWSAACSSGPEVYSLLFLLLKEGFNFNHNQFRILGTDISTSILEKAESLPDRADFHDQVNQLLLKVPNKEALLEEIQLSLNHSLKFREFNLKDGELPLRFQFDVIFLRNVLIYFDRPTIQRVCLNLGKYLKPGGHLVIGLTESLHGEVPEYKFLGNSIYQYQPKAKK